MILNNFLELQNEPKIFYYVIPPFFDVFGIRFYFAKLENDEKQLLNLRKQIDDFFEGLKNKNEY